jgi:hypothetical protein
LFSFENACELTSAFFSRSPGIADSLCQKLVAAETVEMREQFRVRDDILAAYQNQVEAQIGKAIDAANAQELIALAELLKAE